jgi:ubiquinone/menaquinone biosynthesis C-methylase UbiE
VNSLSGHKWHFYDETERRTWQNPEEILQNSGVQAGQTLIDIGCGEGFFTLPAARIVGPRGQVYAIDSSSESMEVLKQKATAENLKNIHLTVNEAESSLVCEGCADWVFMGIVLHDFQDPEQVLRNAHKMLKTGGRLINLDWKKEAMKLGPPLEKRFDIPKATSLLKKAGFRIEKSENCGPYNYVITAGA